MNFDQKRKEKGCVCVGGGGGGGGGRVKKKEAGPLGIKPGTSSLEDTSLYDFKVFSGFIYGIIFFWSYPFPLPVLPLFPILTRMVVTLHLSRVSSPIFRQIYTVSVRDRHQIHLANQIPCFA